MATRAVSKTVNPGSNPGSPVPSGPSEPQLCARPWVLFDARRQGRANFSRGRSVTGYRAILVAIAAAFAALAVIGGPAQARPAGPAGAATADSCPNATDMVTDLTTPDLRKAVRCLIAVERAARGVPKLAKDESLETAAKRHVRTMIDTDCLAHKCPGEVDLKQRLRRAGYFDGVTSYSFAESTGCGTTAESMVTSWLASTFDRASLLDPDFEDLGVAVSPDSSEKLCGESFGTFAVVFGSRVP